MGILPIIFYESITGYFSPTLDVLALQLPQELRLSTSATKTSADTTGPSP